MLRTNFSVTSAAGWWSILNSNLPKLLTLLLYSLALHWLSPSSLVRMVCQTISSFDLGMVVDTIRNHSCLITNYCCFLLFCSLQEAQKRMKIKKPPHILVIHLKRFKYIEQLGRYKKLSYRVVFPLELKLSNTVEDADIVYSLFAVVVHVGSGPNHGHSESYEKP